MGNCQGCAGLLYRITFRAIDTKEGLGEFQAIVFDGIREIVLGHKLAKPESYLDSDLTGCQDLCLNEFGTSVQDIRVGLQSTEDPFD
ncbi:hypothetical protein LguiB_027075 [Lonicera macranthoides]